MLQFFEVYRIYDDSIWVVEEFLSIEDARKFCLTYDEYPRYEELFIRECFRKGKECV